MAASPASNQIEWNTDLSVYNKRKDGVIIEPLIAVRIHDKYPTVSFKVKAKRPLKETYTNWKVDLNYCEASGCELGLDNPTIRHSIDWPIGFSHWIFKGEDIDEVKGFLTCTEKRKWPPSVGSNWNCIEFSADLKTNTLYCAVGGKPFGILATNIEHLEDYYPSICFQFGNKQVPQMAYLTSSPVPFTSTLRDLPLPPPKTISVRTMVAQTQEKLTNNTL